MRPLSLAARLTLFYAVAAAIVFPIFGWLITSAMEDHFEEGDTAELTIIAEAVHDALNGIPSLSDLPSLEARFDDILIGHHSATLHIVRDDGSVLYASDTHPDLSHLVSSSENTPAGDSVELADGPHGTYRVLVRHTKGQPPAFPDVHTIVVATPIDYHLTFLSSFRNTLWLMIVSAIVVMSGIGWLAVRQGHAPLREIAQRMRQVAASERAEAIPPQSVPRELGDLAASFNEMARRVDESFRRLSHFNADIAHELRTPVTNLMTQTQVALSRARTVDEYREVLYSNIEEYERMAQMVGDMLFLAQQDEGASRRATPSIELATEVRALLDYYEGWADERGVTLELDGDTTVSGDRRLLQRAIGNLLSNAIRHTPRGGTVRVELAGGAEVSIEVANSGSRIPADVLPKLFDRFFRADPSRQRRGEGAGLGLAIVKAIAEAHRGRVEAESDERSTRFRMVLPSGR